jgi:hypothetical protein
MEQKIEANTITIKDENSQDRRTINTTRTVGEVADYLDETEIEAVEGKFGRLMEQLRKRYVQHIDPDLKDWWVCPCGNTPDQEGFYPCSSEGEQVEPTPEEWTTDCYVCDRCGRIIKQSNLEVVGVRAKNTLTEEEKKAIFRWQKGKVEL